MTKKNGFPEKQNRLGTRKIQEKLQQPIKVKHLKAEKEKQLLQTILPDIQSLRKKTEINIMEKEHYEKIKKLNETLEAKHKELELFFYKSSHDLRAPFCSAQGLLNLLEMDTRDPLVHNYITLIRKTIDQGEYMFNELTTLSEIYAQKIKAEPIHFNTIIDNTLLNLSHLANFTNITFENNITVSSRFYSNTFLLNTIFKNLIHNAIIYHNIELNPNNSREKNFYPFVKINVTDHKDGVMITVEDNGRGIDNKIIQKIFDMFYRGSEYSTGSGLGLYLTKNAISKLGGKIDVYSELKKGSRFEIILPNMPEGF